MSSICFLLDLTACRRLEGIVFSCGCEIRWIQLWQQRGKAGLHTQQLYCKTGANKIRLRAMNIAHCGINPL